MSVQSFTAYKVVCDIDGCEFAVEGGEGGELWGLSEADAVDIWRNDDQWRDGDRFLCQEHAASEPHEFVGWGHQFCIRCGDHIDDHLRLPAPAVSSPDG